MIALDASAALDLLLRLGAVALQSKRDYCGPARRGTYPNSLDVVRYPHLPLIERIWTLRSNVSVFGAAYLALAEAVDAPVVTADAKLARTPGHRARVELYAR